MTTIQDVRRFLALHRIAVVGVSRNPHEFSRSLFAELKRRGYDLAPVHPSLKEVDGIPCFASVGAIAPAVEGVLLLTNASVTDGVLEDCARAGIRHVWLYRAGGAGAVSPGAVAFCESHGISVIGGECPLMFLPESAWFHRFHGFCRKVTGKYPRTALTA